MNMFGMRMMRVRGFSAAALQGGPADVFGGEIYG